MLVVNGGEFMRTTRLFLIGWGLFAFVSTGLLVMYLYGDAHRHPEFESALKGLGYVDHFLIHYSVGVVTGLLILIAWQKWKRARLSAPLILTLTVVWSHLPDLRAAATKDLHDWWEIIFLFHTVVDEIHGVVWAMIPLAILLGWYYHKKIT